MKLLRYLNVDFIWKQQGLITVNLIWKRTLQMHIVFWIILAILAYVTAGPGTLASCWPLAFFIPFSGIVFFVLIVWSIMTLWRWGFSPHLRFIRSFIVESHIMIMTFGLIACFGTAGLATEHVSCM
jgi:hypothetical protein